MRKQLILPILFFLLSFATVYAQSDAGISNPLPEGMNFLYPGSGPKSGFSSPGLFKSANEFADLADSAYKGRYDTVNLTFKLTLRSYFEYDSGGLLIQSLNKSVDKNGNWKNYSMDTLTYTGPLLNKVVSRQWDSPLNSWKNTFRYDYFYSTQNVLESMIINTWKADSMIWVPAERYEYSYSSPGLIGTVVYQLWNNSLLSWINNMKTSYIFNPQGLPTSGTLEQWSEAQQTWSPYSRSTYTNLNGHTTELVTELFNTTLSNWHLYDKYLYTYTSEGKEETVTRRIYETGSGNWMNSSLTTNTYQGGNLVNVLLKTWEKHLNDWRNFEQKDSYFSSHEVFGTSEIAVVQLVLRNPVKSGMTVETNLPFSPRGYLLEMLDMGGRSLQSIRINQGDSFTIPNVPAGIYILRATTNNSQPLVQRLLIIN